MPLPKDHNSYPTQYTELTHRCAEGEIIPITLATPSAARRLRFKFYRWRKLLPESPLKDSALAIHIKLEQEGEEMIHKKGPDGILMVKEGGVPVMVPCYRKLRFIAVDSTDEALAITAALEGAT